MPSKLPSPRSALRGLVLAAITSSLLAGCGGAGEGSAPNASPDGIWVGGYLGDGAIHNLRLDIRTNLILVQWVDSTNYGGGINYLVNGSALIWVSGADAPFRCISGSAIYGSTQASATITGSSMTVVYTSPASYPCSAGGTVTLTKQ